ncbi:dual specificity protein phosphatase 3-like isoform X2 [Venturia canescens]|uniref:dual specificity protein phosphatase 3-like isoform X2 n=1 Tax=Venturia canescens TaxID=32260 RepID=UPI001C9C4481|nr:dual specificity protein phosphatase 3-like isoform X2 [Venturia canescens]
MAYYSGLRNEDFRKPLVDGETTFAQLIMALHDEQPIRYKPLPGFDSDYDSPEYRRLQQTINCDEVYPGIFIGDESTAKNKNYLARIGITHVLNAAEGNRFGCVNTNEHFYRGTNIKYCGLQLTDLPSTDISKYFYTAAAFIEDALKNGGRVLVHCVMGISRSATCVIAYLMIKKHMMAADAIRLIRQSRAIHPNEGFLRQLAALDNQLRRSRL